MPVITRSCGRGAPRRRIEDPTPRTVKTTAKRRKDVSDEENERPPKKKQHKLTPKTSCDKNQRSRIPRRCLTENNSMKTKSQVSYNNKDDDDDEIQFKITAEAKKMKKTETQQPAQGQCVKQQTPFVSPVAARTRSYSALKRSYKRKKKNIDEVNKSNDMEISSISTSTEDDGFENSGEDSLQEREKEDKTTCKAKEVDSSTCNNGNDHHVNSSDQEKNDQYYKDKFHEMVQNLRQMQEQFSQAHQNTCKNITAYDVFIKELKTRLEQEKRKNFTMEEELKETREKLLLTQKEMETANEQQNNNRSINTTCISQEPSQSEERSQQSEVEDLEKAETSTLLAMIKCYAELTGITLSMDTPPSNLELIESFQCAYRPKGPTGHVMQFHLTYDKEFEEYEYSPNFQTSPKGEGYLHKIPRHLKKNICFGSDQAQSFLSSLIKAKQNKTGR